MKRGVLRYLTMLWLLCLVARAMGQTDAGVQEPVPLLVPSDTAEAIFLRLKPQTDSTYLKRKLQVKENFWKRVSFHTNLVDWAMTLPNLGVELDLGRGTRTNRSLLLFGKFNGQSRQKLNSKAVFNYLQLRGEYRKYWRTGNIGAKGPHPEYVPLHLRKPRNRRTQQFGKVRVESIDSFYVTREDSLAARGRFYNGDPNRGWWYNHYHKARRTLSGRTLQHPRNWRAYYLGAYALLSKHSICFRGKGNQGSGLGVGLTAGWSIPLLPNRYPHEGGLDLDLGLNVGVKAVRNDKYRFDEEFRCYVPTSLGDGTFKFVKAPVLEDIHIALVYRFRSIRYKSDLALVDDYETVIEKFNTKRKELYGILKDSIEHLQTAENIRKTREVEMNDSIAFWDKYHARRLLNARLLNPDTVFTDTLDIRLERKLFADEVMAREARMLQDQKPAKQLGKKNEKARKEGEKEAKKARKKKSKTPEKSDSSESSETFEPSAYSETSEPSEQKGGEE